MPYIKVTPNQIRKKEFPDELKEDQKRYTEYKLCYIDGIPQTIFDMRPEIKEKYKDFLSLPFEQYREKTWIYPDFRYEDLPNPDYKNGEYELNAYFTPIPLYEQTGDDWDDVPYECNAEIPYDDVIVESKITDSGVHVATKIEHYNIIVVPFCVKSINYMQPKDYGYNSPFCVDMINSGAVAWIYDSAESGKIKDATCIYAGCSLEEFIRLLDRIEENNPNYKPLDSDD